MCAVRKNLNLRDLLQAEFLFRRALDTGNPNPGNLGTDFNRLGVDFWDKVKALDPANVKRQKLLLELNEWRNAIAHQDFTKVRSTGTTSHPYLRLSTVRDWRVACDRLAVDFDTVMSTHIASLIGNRPW